jgi:hypothetical protein
MAVTTRMVGHGFYDRNSAPQWAAIEAILPWLDAAIAEMRLADLPPTIAVADFGRSEGQNSIQVRVCQRTRGRGRYRQEDML